MKKYFGALMMITMLTTSMPQIIKGQCETDEFLDRCASNLGTYNYIKTFITQTSSKKKTNPESLYVFSKGSTYKIIACLGDPGGNMIINLYDKNHNLIASTYNEETKKHYSELQYPCPVTGVYYIRTTFEGIKEGCGMCILGFSKDEL